MIELKELNVGNWVSRTAGDLIDPIQVKLEDLVNHESLEPIEISEMMLFTLGFRPDESGDFLPVCKEDEIYLYQPNENNIPLYGFYIINTSLQLDGIKKVWLFCDFLEVKYIHELQNLITHISKYASFQRDAEPTDFN